MKKTFRKIKDVFSTLSLTVLFTLNLFFIVFLFLAFVTLLVYFGVDGGFLVTDGHVTIGGALTMIYAVCIFIALSIVIMIRMVFIGPIRKIMAAMGRLAKGDFSVRIDMSNEAYRPREIREFAESFNKAAEELSGTEILRKDFINNFSHEFKTPIVSIRGFAKQLERDDLTDEQRREYLDIIVSESDRLANMASNVLLLSKLENQTIVTDKARFALDEQLRRAILLLEKQWTEKALDLDVDLEAVELYGNEEMLNHVWVNLLGNAVKFSPDGGRLTVRLRREGDFAACTVRDAGPGMDEETRRRVFEKFYQGDTAHATEGNGLGLALVRRIVDLCGGDIAVESAPGAGSAFIVRLPLRG